MKEKTRLCLLCFERRPELEIKLNTCQSKACIQLRLKRWAYAARRVRKDGPREIDPETCHLHLVKP